MSTRVFFEPIRVSEYVEKHINKDLTRGLSHQDRIKVKKALNGVYVETQHEGIIRRHKISGITTMSIQHLMFSLDGTKAQISVAKYFINKYNIFLQYPSLPALQAGSDTKLIYLPMKLCKIAEGQRFSRKLNISQVTALLKATCQRPRVREISIMQEFNRRPLVPVRNAHVPIEKALIDLETEFSKTGKQLQLLIVILPEMTGSYGTIKRVCETELGIVSQCCLPKNVSKPGKQYMQYLENVSLKINAKAGGRNSVLEMAVKGKFPYLSDRPTIIFGADVTHPQPGEDSSPSIAAVVASTDWPEVTKYRALVSTQAHREEIIQDLYS
ncbi:protein argonaute MEL1-like, partial [Salvia splendens]|uniref:protein argonaute MEL1-like n=1 Tax=Salvia splendens TaxID=180675 RepID=UPI001C273AA8